MEHNANSSDLSAALQLARDCEASLISPLTAAKKIIHLLGCLYYCDKLKSGKHSLKLCNAFGTPIADTDAPYELTAILNQLCDESRTMGLLARNSDVRSDTETITRYYFA